MDQNPQPTPRRRFFRFAALSTAAAGMAGLGFSAFAHGHRHGRGPMDPAAMDERLDRMLKHLYVEIDATEAQKQKLDPIVKQAAGDMRPLRAKVQDARRRGAELLSAETIDRGAIERQRAEQISATDAASRRFTQALADVAEVLTPAQRKTLAARLERRSHSWRHG
jgi:Spy/CpxP family protein refolding chaperone